MANATNESRRMRKRNEARRIRSRHAAKERREHKHASGQVEQRARVCFDKDKGLRVQTESGGVYGAHGALTLVPGDRVRVRVKPGWGAEVSRVEARTLCAVPAVMGQGEVEGLWPGARGTLAMRQDCSQVVGERVVRVELDPDRTWGGALEGVRWERCREGSAHEVSEELSRAAYGYAKGAKDGTWKGSRPRWEGQPIERGFRCYDKAGTKVFSDAVRVRRQGAGWVLDVAFADVGGIIRFDDQVDRQARRLAFVPGELRSNGKGFRIWPLEVIEATRLRVREPSRAVLVEVRTGATDRVESVAVRRAWIEVDEALSFEQGEARAHEDARTLEGLDEVLARVYPKWRRDWVRDTSSRCEELVAGAMRAGGEACAASVVQARRGVRIPGPAGRLVGRRSARGRDAHAFGQSERSASALRRSGDGGGRAGGRAVGSFAGRPDRVGAERPRGGATRGEERSCDAGGVDREVARRGSQRASKNDQRWVKWGRYPRQSHASKVKLRPSAGGYVTWCTRRHGTSRTVRPCASTKTVPRAPSASWRQVAGAWVAERSRTRSTARRAAGRTSGARKRK